MKAKLYRTTGKRSVGYSLRSAVSIRDQCHVLQLLCELNTEEYLNGVEPTTPNRAAHVTKGRKAPGCASCSGATPDLTKRFWRGKRRLGWKPGQSFPTTLWNYKKCSEAGRSLQGRSVLEISRSLHLNVTSTSSCSVIPLALHSDMSHTFKRVSEANKPKFFLGRKRLSFFFFVNSVLYSSTLYTTEHLRISYRKLETHEL